ncbi:DUF1328 domain-containing protein [Vermiphilus pyriformis]|jgi:uncharacterized membrane protein YtjA (UPF0391 family)|uniref:Membrane protein n=1 Tax=candidate division TM6 bacterium JCVI TM6SC1 TaxID=1306947 RepID=A0A0D2K4V6_9BACT|nr:membrane protein [candidate division TM6 bacterium JCVI TM6SC1]UNE35283.1 MAG: DUF1328 domain-containing protein [Vermiphilus pyriformis]
MLLDWVVIFLVLALVSGLFGFTGVSAQFASMGKILFVIFLVLFVVSLVMRMMGRRPPTV